MNSVQNSDSEQCTESRLGQVHSVHTPMAHVVRTLTVRQAVSWRTRRRLAGLPRPYRGLLLGRVVARTDHVTARTGHVAARTGHVAACTGRVASCVAARSRALLRVMSQASSTVSCARSAVSWLCRSPLLARPGLRACSAYCVPAQPAVCLLSLLCATIQPAICHNTACCIVTQF